MFNKIKKQFKDNDINIYKIIWVFTLMAFLGCVIENVWYYVKWDKFVYNQGMVFGPFKQIYGFGGILITLLATILKDKKVITIFIFGFVFFGLFEYLSGLYLEVFTHTFAWDYSRVGYSLVIGKYVYLPYCFVWGLFAILWTKVFYKKINQLLDILTKNKMKFLTIIVGIFFIVNLSLTILATKRFVDRHNGDAPNNFIEKYIDSTFDDAYMQKWLHKIRVL